MKRNREQLRSSSKDKMSVVDKVDVKCIEYCKMDIAALCWGIPKSTKWIVYCNSGYEKWTLMVDIGLLIPNKLYDKK